MRRPSSRPASKLLAAAVLCACTWCPGFLLAADTTLLFQGKASSATMQNKWEPWFKAGTTVTRGDGKRADYDSLPISSLTFSSDGGVSVSYALKAAYTNKPLRAIVAACMGGARTQTSGGKWPKGHCEIGTKTASTGRPTPTADKFANLRIGVGDSASASSDSGDWALFMPLTGHGGGDYKGNKAWVFGGEQMTNNAAIGGGGMVYIRATSATLSLPGGALPKMQRPAARPSLRMPCACAARYFCFVFKK